MGWRQEVNSILENVTTPLCFKDHASETINSRQRVFHAFLHNLLQHLHDSPTQAIKPYFAL